MGWLGWPADQALDTAMPYIALALHGRVKMLQAIGLLAAPPPPPPTDEQVADQIKAAMRAAGAKRKEK